MLGGGATWGDGYDRRGQSKCFATLDSSGHITKWTHDTTQHNTTLVRKSQQAQLSAAAYFLGRYIYQVLTLVWSLNDRWCSIFERIQIQFEEELKCDRVNVSKGRCWSCADTFPLIGFVNSQQTRAAICFVRNNLYYKSITITIRPGLCQQPNAGC